MKPWAALAALAALGLAVVVAASWPLVLVHDTHLLGRLADPDLGAGLWWTHTFVDCVLELRNPFSRTELNWPFGQDLRLLMWNIGLQALLFPIHAVLEPVAALNASAVAIATANGVACGWAAWQLTRDRWGAAAAVVVAAASQYALWEAAVGRTEQGFWAPLAIWLGAMLWFRDGGGRKAIVVAGLGLGLAGACYWFHAWFGVLATVVLLVAWRKADILGVFGVSLVVVLPSLALIAPAFFEDGNAYGLMMDRLDPLAQKMAGSLEFPGAFVHGKTGDPARKVPLLLIPVAVVGLFFKRLRTPAIVVLVALLLALGPILVGARGFPVMWGDARWRLPAGFMDWLPGHARFWWPYRWLGLALPAFAICTGGLVAKLPRLRVVAVAGLALVSIADAQLGLRNGRQGEDVWLHAMAPVFPELDGPIVVWPVGEVPNDLIGYAAFHRQPQAGGIAWDMAPAIRGDAYEQRRRELALFRALDQASMRHGTVEDWSDSGGFRYVLAVRPGLTRYLGDPIWTDGSLQLYELPTP